MHDLQKIADEVKIKMQKHLAMTGGEVDLRRFDRDEYHGFLGPDATKIVAKHLGLVEAPHLGAYTWVDPNSPAGSRSAISARPMFMSAAPTQDPGLLNTQNNLANAQRQALLDAQKFLGMPPMSIVPGTFKVAPGSQWLSVDKDKPKSKIKCPFKKGDIVELTEEYEENPAGSKMMVLIADDEGEESCCALEGGSLDPDEGFTVPWALLKKVKPPIKVTMESVVMSKDKKEEIKAAISQVHNNDLIFDKWGFGDVFEKGTAISLLFYGIPGTGKTLMAQAIADSMDMQLKLYGTADIESSEPGGAERMIRTIFKEAKNAKHKRLILFDECDSLLMDRNEVGPILAAQVNTLLSELEHYTGIIVFTTNRLGKLDAAMERRITAKIEFEFPDQKARRDIWKRMIPKKAPLKDIDFDKLAEYQIAGGNIKNVVLNAARAAAYQKKKALEMSHFIIAIEREESSLKAFRDQAAATPHSQMVGGADYSREHGKVGITEDKEINIKKKMSFWNKPVGGGNK